jgi:cell wall-associated NlpC family hydrolase
MADYHALIGLPWDYGKQDCYTLIRQYFKLQGIELPDFPRPDDLETTPSIYLREAVALGFKLVPLNWRQPGDVLIMRLGTQHPMHAAVLVDYQQILHQRQDSLSAVECLRQYHIDRVAAVFRYAAGRPTAG